VYAQPLFVLVEWEIWVRLFKRKAPKRSGHSATSAAGSRGLSAVAGVSAVTAAHQQDVLGQAAVLAQGGAAAGVQGKGASLAAVEEQAGACGSKDLDLEEAASSPAELKLPMSPFEVRHRAGHVVIFGEAVHAQL
jgi:hypothetical protein